MTIEEMSNHDRPAVRALLERAGLPLDGFDEPHVIALVARDDARIVGSAALEVYEPYGLLRSVAVDDRHRGQGLGQLLTSEALALARRRALSSLYLLTDTAAPFFARLGFAAIPRSEVPPEVARSVEFTTACPASATVMMRRL